MQHRHNPDDREAQSEAEWIFDHWYKQYMEDDPEPKRRSFILTIVVSVLAIVVNAGAVEISQSTLSGFTIAPRSAVAVGAILTAASVGLFLTVLMQALGDSRDDLSISYFVEKGVKRAVVLQSYKNWMSQNEPFKGLTRAIVGVFAFAFILSPIASIITFALSLREVL